MLDGSLPVREGSASHCQQQPEVSCRALQIQLKCTAPIDLDRRRRTLRAVEDLVSRNRRFLQQVAPRQLKQARGPSPDPALDQLTQKSRQSHPDDCPESHPAMKIG